MTSRKLVIGVAKVVLIAGLMVFVFYNIQWRDSLTRIDASGASTVTAGKILGPWDVEVVRFETPAGVVEVGPGAGPEGSRVEVTPGFLTYVGNLDPLLFGIGALCYFLAFWFSSVRWWWLLRVNALAVSKLEALRYTWIGTFFNNVVPGLTGGDVVKALYVMKRVGAGGRVQALVSVIVDRILGLGSLALLGAIVVLFYLDRFPQIAAGIWSVLAFVGLLGTVAFSKRVRKFVRLDMLLRRLPMSHLLQKVDHAIYFYRGHKVGIVVWLFVGVASHVLSVLSVMYVGDALGVGMPAVEYFVLVPVINIVSAVPIFPAGWGVGEVAYKVLFSEFGARYLNVVDPARVMATRGVALSVLYRIHTTLWSLVGGALALLDRDRVTRADVEQEIAREEHEPLV